MRACPIRVPASIVMSDELTAEARVADLAEGRGACDIVVTAADGRSVQWQPG